MLMWIVPTEAAMNCSRYLATLSAATACLACGGYSQPVSPFRLELSGSSQSTTEAGKPGISTWL